MANIIGGRPGLLRLKLDEAADVAVAKNAAERAYNAPARDTLARIGNDIADVKAMVRAQAIDDKVTKERARAAELLAQLKAKPKPPPCRAASPIIWRVESAAGVRRWFHARDRVTGALLYKTNGEPKLMPYVEGIIVLSAGIASCPADARHRETVKVTGRKAAAVVERLTALIGPVAAVETVAKAMIVG